MRREREEKTIQKESYNGNDNKHTFCIESKRNIYIELGEEKQIVRMLNLCESHPNLYACSVISQPAFCCMDCFSFFLSIFTCLFHSLPWALLQTFQFSPFFFSIVCSLPIYSDARFIRLPQCAQSTNIPDRGIEHSTHFPSSTEKPWLSLLLYLSFSLLHSTFLFHSIFVCVHAFRFVCLVNLNRQFINIKFCSALFSVRLLLALFGALNAECIHI